MALSDYLDKVVPAWMRRAPSDHWYGLALTISAVFDAMLDGILDGAFADMPGQTEGSDEFGSTDALHFIGRDARIPRGFNETVPDYASRLRDPYAYHRGAGTAWGMLHAMRAILGPNPPKLRLVNALGTWWTLDADGTFTFNPHDGYGFSRSPAGVFTFDGLNAFLWDWDSASVPPPPDQNDPGRGWFIIYAPCDGKYLAKTEGKWGDKKSKYGDFQKVVGTDSTSPHVELRRGIANTMRTAGVKLSHIIIAFDPDSFDPASPAGTVGMPDGTWGHRSKLATLFGGKRVRRLARLQSARYVRGHAGTDY